MSDIATEAHVNGNGIVDSASSDFVEPATHQVDVEDGPAAAGSNQDAASVDGDSDSEVTKPVKKRAVPLDITSDEAFPSLGPAKPAPAVKMPAWTKQPTNANDLFTPSRNVVAPRSGAKNASNQTSVRFEMLAKDKIPDSQLSQTLGAIIGSVKKYTGARIEHHKDRENNSTFLISGTANDIKKAQNELLKELGIKITQTVDVPVSVRAHIIGKQGKVVKEITDKTGTKIKVPDSNEQIPSAEEDDEPYIKVAITGVKAGVDAAVSSIMAIVADKRPPVTLTVDDVEGKYYPHVQKFLRDLGAHVRAQVPKYFMSSSSRPLSPASGPIVLIGDKAAVQDVRKQIREHIETLELTEADVPIPFSHHRFLVGADGSELDDFVQKTGCSIVLPTPDKAANKCFIIGPIGNLADGVKYAKEKASSYHPRSFDILKAYSDKEPHVWNIIRYFEQANKLQSLKSRYGVEFVVPTARAGNSIPVIMYGKDQDKVVEAGKEFVALVNSCKPYRFKEIEIDPNHQRQLLGNGGKQLKTIQESTGVHFVFERDEPVAVLAYEKDLAENEEEAVAKALAETEKQLNEIIQTLPAVHSQTLSIPTDAHELLLGPRGTTLNALKYGSVHVTVGVPEAKAGRKQRAGKPDEINVRGAQKDVELTVKQIKSQYERIKAGAAGKVETESIDFPKQFRGSIIGAKGANLSKMKEEYDVDVQLKEGNATLKGIQPNLEAAKRKLLAQVKQLEDTAILRIKVPAEHHKTIIGTGGKLVRRLEDKYNVRIKFPKNTSHDDDAASDAGTSHDEVVIKGPKKGANEAREEIEELLKYEIDHNHTAVVQIAAKAVSKLLTTGVKDLKRIREDSGARIDVPSDRETSANKPKVDIKIRGTKTEVNKAVKDLQKLVNEMESLKTVSLDIDKKYHRLIIGSGGSNLSDIVVKAGGPSDRSAQAKIVRFPNHDSEAKVVRVEGEAAVVDKIVESLQELLKDLETRVTGTLEVAPEHHRKLIGREGNVRRELESKFKVNIDIPKQGSGSSTVKLAGSPEAVEAVKAHIQEMLKKDEGETVQVPASVHSDISEGGAFARKLRNDFKVTVDHGGHRFPPRSADKFPSRPTNGTNPLPLITDDKSAVTFSWSLQETQKSEEKESKPVPWILRGAPENIAKAKEAIQKAIESASGESYTGFLVLPDPKKYRFVVGPGGSQINKIKQDTGCKVRVPKDASDGEAIVIVGSKEGAEKAKDTIVELVGLKN